MRDNRPAYTRAFTHDAAGNVTYDNRSGGRYGQPQARMVVLRRVDIGQHLLEFHTDIRSRKWAELAANPKATALGYDATTRLQLRIMGDVTRLEGVAAREAWDSLTPWTRATYAGGPPGDEQAFDAPSAPLDGRGICKFWGTAVLGRHA
ncbi:MAG: pyridoxamine 5'-phosphate oxidase family protein [Pseudorhodoplanes sp.]